MYFRDIIGHSNAKNMLTKMVKDGHVGHALMFTGDEGSGNLPMAAAFAGYILCENPQDGDRCGSCVACKQVNNLSHPDLHIAFPTVKKKSTDPYSLFAKEFNETFSKHPFLTLKEWEIESASENKRAILSVVDSGEIIKSLSLKSFSGGHKVMIIWHADKMNVQAANKILKTLEEPTEKTVVILVVENSEEMLPTVVSRTQLVNCGKVSDEEIKSWLIEKHGVSDELARDAARAADGNYNLAEHLAKGDGSDADEFLSHLMKWMRACVKSDTGKALEVTQKIAGYKRDKQQYFLEYCLEFLHRSVLYKHVGPEESRFDSKTFEFGSKFAPYIVDADLNGFHDVFSKGHYLVSRNANPQLLFMKMSLDMMKLFHTHPKNSNA